MIRTRVDAQAIIVAFKQGDRNLQGQDDVLHKAIQLCDEFSLGASELRDKWEAYITNSNFHDVPGVTIEHFDAIRRDIQAKSRKNEKEPPKKQKLHQKAYTMNTMNTIPMVGARKIIGGHGGLDPTSSFSAASPSTPALKENLGKRKHEDTDHQRSRPFSKATPSGSSMMDSPYSGVKMESSPETAASYMKREQHFKVHSTFNEALPAADRARAGNLASRIEITNIQSVTPARYMYEKVEAKCQALRERLRNLTDGIIENARLRQTNEDFRITPVNAATQEKVFCCGRICCEGDVGSLNPSSVMIEGANGRRVKLDLSSVGEFAVFAGQIVVVEGHNVTGECIKAHAVYCDASLPMYQTAASQIALYNETDAYLGGTPLSVLVAAGPFTLSGDLSYKPLDDLLAHVRDTNPDVLVLCGPFVDARHHLLDPAALGTPGGFSNGQPPDSTELLSSVLTDHVVEGLQGTGTTCIILPSLADLAARPVFPQPAFYGEVISPRKEHSKSRHQVHPLLFSNPCSFKINEIVFQIANTDILAHLSGNEANRISGDRMSRLGKHIVEQRSVYPLFPAAEGAQVSMSQIEKLTLQGSPDIMIVPSNIMAFAKRAGETLLVNPGRLTKGNTAGTFAKLTVHPILRHIRTGATRKIQAPSSMELNENKDSAKEGEEMQADSPSGKATAGEDVCAEIVPQQLSQDFEATMNEGSEEELVEDSSKEGTEIKTDEEHRDEVIQDVKHGDEEGKANEASEDQVKMQVEESKEDAAVDTATASKEQAAEVDGQKSAEKDIFMEDNKEIHAPVLHRVLERTRVDIVKI